MKGRWTYLHRALDKSGATVDFCLSPTRSTKVANRFLGKALSDLKHWQKPASINADKAPTHEIGTTALKNEGELPVETLHRQGKYLNNIIEADHGKLKMLIELASGFKSLKTAYATVKDRGDAYASKRPSLALPIW